MAAIEQRSGIKFCVANTNQDRGQAATHPFQQRKLKQSKCCGLCFSPGADFCTGLSF